MSFRFIMQPADALFLAFRVELKDARGGQASFLWAAFSTPSRRHGLSRQGRENLGAVVIVALISDAARQSIARSGFYTLELSPAATTLTPRPDASPRGPVTRLARRSFAATPTRGRSGNQDIERNPAPRKEG